MVRKHVVNGYEIRIVPDYDAENPHESCDNLGTFAVRRGNRYFGHLSEVEPEEAEKHREEETALVLPVYGYVHSGQTISCSPFSCPWDSGQIGFIFVTYDRIKEEYGAVTQETLQLAREVLEVEVKVMASWYEGDFCGYEIVKEGDDEEEILDSAWGFESEEAALEDAKEIVIHLLQMEKMW